jgi:hypothetical protein
MAEIPEPLRGLLANPGAPKNGEVWRRSDGALYRVVTLSAWQPNPEAVVITLRSLATGACESLPLADFLSPTESAGRPLYHYRPAD